MRRIGLFFNHADIVGGGEISFLDLAAALRGTEFVPVGLTVGAGAVADRLRARDIETHAMPLPPIRPCELPAVWRAGRGMLRQFRALRLDLAHVNGARAMLYAGPAARRCGIPCLWHVRVLDRDRLLDRIRGHYATAVIANSKAVAASLRPVTGKFAHVIYNGLDLDEWRNAPRVDLAALFGLPKDMPVILAVGRLSRWKGFADLIAACARLRADGVRAVCLLVGAPDEHDRQHAEELKRMANESGLMDCFVFAGRRDDVPSLMKSAAALALPSHGEPFGRVLIEAWAAGLPVAATAAGGPAELIADGETGLLTPVGDPAVLANALARIVSDKLLADRLRARGAARAEEFSLRRHVDAVKRVYVDCVGGRNQG